MKIIAVGDVHGRDFWKKVAEKESDFDMFIFIGDYFDSFNISPEKQQENFLEILDFKTRNEDKVKMLIGNHDMHYLPWATQQCSGFSVENLVKMTSLLSQLVKAGRMQVCWQHKNVMFSHAGFTRTWLTNTGIFEGLPLEAEVNVQDFVNDLFLKRIELFEYQSIDTSGYGEHIAQSPLWVRPDSLKTDTGGGITQVIGHTTFDNIFAITDFDEENKQPIICIDAPKSGEYIFIGDDGVIRIESIYGSKKA